MQPRGGQSLRSGAQPSAALWGTGTGRSPQGRRRPVAWPPATWMTTSESSWPIWSPRPTGRPGSRVQPRKARVEKQNQFAISCSVHLLQLSRLAGRQCRKPRTRDFPCGLIPGRWACHGWPPRNMPKQKVPQPNALAPSNGPRRKPQPNNRPPQISQGDIFGFQLRGHNRWTTTAETPTFLESPWLVSFST